MSDLPTGPKTVAQKGQPISFEPSNDLPIVPGYSLTQKIASGGMGTVYAAYDPAFDRQVAIKVMHAGQDAERFVVESKITAQLPHPGVPPVYALGELADGRPFLAMKLIKGRTLADELKDATPADLPRLLAAFERISETVGFAHSRKIIHRDLKPANIMIGAFGEVLVMDWGLAKRLSRSGNGERDRDSPTSQNTTAETVAGVVKGTPAYMAPEQARGEPVDARADVFALGGVLCVILSGKPPFIGTTVLDTVLRAASADLMECFARLDASGADQELLPIVYRCLAPQIEDRYWSGEDVAAAMAAFRARVDRRLRQAETERTAAAAWQKKRRMWRVTQVALASTVMALVCGVAGVAQWRGRQAEAGKQSVATQKELEGKLERSKDTISYQRREEAKRIVKLSSQLRKIDRYRFEVAEAALDLAPENPSDDDKYDKREQHALVVQARRDLQFVEKLDHIRFRKWLWNANGRDRGEFATALAPPAYRRAFSAYNFDLTALTPVDAAARINKSDVRDELLTAVIDWALYEPDAAFRDRLLDVARQTLGPWRCEEEKLLLDSGIWADKDKLKRLAVSPHFRSSETAMTVALAELMMRNALDPSELLATVAKEYPGDFEPAFALARWALVSGDRRAVGWHKAAIAIRPDSRSAWNNYGVTLVAAGNGTEGIKAYKQALHLCSIPFPESLMTEWERVAHRNAEKATEHLRTASQQSPINVNHTVWDEPEALLERRLRVILRIDRDGQKRLSASNMVEPQLEAATLYNNLALAFQAKGEINRMVGADQEFLSNLDRSIESYRQSLQLNSKQPIVEAALADAIKRRVEFGKPSQVIPK